MIGSTLGNLVDVVDEDDPELHEPVDDQLVVDDLVVAVDGRLEGPHHPAQRLDRHLDPGTESTGGAEQDLVDRGRPGGIVLIGSGSF